MLNFLKYINSPLLKPVALIILIVSALVTSSTIYILSSRIDKSTQDVRALLQEKAQRVDSILLDSNKMVSEDIQNMRATSGALLNEKLSLTLFQEQAIISESLRFNQEQALDTLANILAQVGGLALAQDNRSQLNQLAELAHRNFNVVAALYLNASGEPASTYVNPDRAQLKQWGATTPSAEAIRTVLRESVRDDTLEVRELDLSSNGINIGKFVLVISSASLASEVNAMENRFGKIIENSGITIEEVIAEQSDSVDATLREVLKEVETAFADTSQATIERLEDNATTLTGFMTAVSITGSLATLAILVFVMANQFIGKIDRMSRAMSNAAKGDGDLTRRVDATGSGEISDMGRAMNAFMEQVRGIIMEVNDSSDQALAFASQLHEQASRSHQTADGQQRSIARIASDFSEITDGFDVVSHDAQQAADDLHSIKQDTERNAEVSHNLKALLDDMIDRVRHTSSVVDNLQEKSTQIGVVLDVIKGIAEQTNLLALNAAIEAARAGESGRGFAVVAEEVRNLAGKTQQSTEEIQNSIEQMQEGSRQAVMAITDAVEAAERGSESFTESDQLVENVLQSVTQVFDKIRHVAATITQQTQTARDVNERIHSINEAAEFASNSAAQSEQTVQELGQVTDTLHARLSRFKV